MNDRGNVKPCLRPRRATAFLGRHHYKRKYTNNTREHNSRVTRIGHVDLNTVLIITSFNSTRTTVKYSPATILVPGRVQFKQLSIF